MDVRRSDLSEPEVKQLLALHHSEMRGYSPPGTCHVLDIDALRAPDIDVFAAWDGDRLLAIGALKAHDGFAEIKSMRAHPDARGQGAGRAILAHLLDHARSTGHPSVKLETGSGGLFADAIALYEKFGFVRCAPFAGYTPGTFTRLYSLDLS
ncbi:GNAT family N-acetyltransferase [Qipengyuania nanhaisediminis]|uniref:GNAT family N-acetyltransferase n=1 Tax=Qipengyuania nanhaisediminis TaxID=604088 RepID=UPI0038B27DFF